MSLRNKIFLQNGSKYFRTNNIDKNMKLEL